MSKANISVGNQGWADRFNEAWNSSNEKILEACEILVSAQKDLPKADFADLIKNKVRCGESVARKLIIVGKDERLRALVHKLPVHWSTHYEFTKLTDDEFHEALARDDISNMRRNDVKKLRKPTVTDAEYHDVTQSPDPHPGVAVSAEGESSTPPQTPAFVSTPHDERQDGDSAVTPDDGLQGHYQGADEVEHFDNSSATSDRADESCVTIQIKTPAYRLAYGLSLAMQASKQMGPEEAARLWPSEMPLLSGELTEFVDWMLDFNDGFRNEHGPIGNDAALEAAQ